MKPSPLYAVIGDYAFLAETIDDRRVEKRIAVDDLDELADLARGFASKACGPSQSAKWGLATPAGKANGAGKPGSLFRVLEALGLRLALIVDEKAEKAALTGEKLRRESHVRLNTYTRQPSMRVFRRARAEMGKRGGKARWAGKSAAERKAHCRMMARSRYGKLSAPAETGQR